MAHDDRKILAGLSPLDFQRSVVFLITMPREGAPVVRADKPAVRELPV